MPSEHAADTSAQTEMVRPASAWPSRFEGQVVGVAQVVRDVAPVPLAPPQTVGLSGWQVVTMFTVAIVGLTVAASVADTTALVVVSSSVTSLATGFLLGRRN